MEVGWRADATKTEAKAENRGDDRRTVKAKPNTSAQNGAQARRRWKGKFSSESPTTKQDKREMSRPLTPDYGAKRVLIYKK